MNQNSSPRNLLKRLHLLMAGSTLGQERLNLIVHEIAANMATDVCSLYLMDQNGVLELYAAEGLRQEAVHRTRLKSGEGLIGLIARERKPFNLSEASEHPKFVYFPETGEEKFHSLMGVPILRRGRVVGVLAVQNVEPRHYAEEEIEALQTVAMVLAELLGEEELAAESDLKVARRQAAGNITIEAQIYADGLAEGEAVFHEPKVEIDHVAADNVDDELERFSDALGVMRQQLEAIMGASDLEHQEETREIIETYKMFAYDRGWQDKIKSAIETGLTAEAAVERIQQDLKARMSRAQDPYLQERLSDLESLSARLIRVLMGYYGEAAHHKLTKPSIIVARAMGPAELLEYDRKFVRGIVLEGGSATSHLAIVARALEVPFLGQATGVLQETEEHDQLIVDGVAGRVIVRPEGDVRHAYEASLKERALLVQQYAKQVKLPPVTKDGTRIELLLNAGLLIDLENLKAMGASGVGLFRTEFQFMVSATMPRMKEQTELYTKALKFTGKKKLIFRTLDIGGDKRVPFLPHVEEENPAMGWRGVRLGLDKPGLLKYQMRALIASAAGKELSIMFPMVATSDEFIRARAMLDEEISYANRMKKKVPKRINVGCMLEIPSLAWDLDRLLDEVDFLSIGTNDLLQFFFASERGNARISSHYDALSPQVLRFLRGIITRCQDKDVPLTVCGEMAGRPLEAMALIALGINSFSISAPSISPVKMMVRSLELQSLRAAMEGWLSEGETNIRHALLGYAMRNEIFVS